MGFHLLPPRLTIGKHGSDQGHNETGERNASHDQQPVKIIKLWDKRVDQAPTTLKAHVMVPRMIQSQSTGKGTISSCLNV